MMVRVWHVPPVHQECRVSAPVASGRDRLRDAFFADVGRLTLGTVRGERWRLRLGPLTLLAFAEPVYDGWAWAWPITGGLLARRPGGTLRYGWRDGQLVASVDGYEPRLPALLYRLTQVPVHRLLTRRFLLHLRGRTPAPAPPAGPAQRLLTATLDLALCAGVTAVVTRRRRLRTFAAVAAGYHLACWTLGGRTLGGALTGQRLVSVDGSAVAPWQALVRLGALPSALLTLRAVHDEEAGTEVVEA
ncbi:MAG TPA: hypothetical protein VE953_04020 [Terriglobales bacterium]|nr:hypothetical protein [Terriglobales bacterium]